MSQQQQKHDLIGFACRNKKLKYLCLIYYSKYNKVLFVVNYLIKFCQIVFGFAFTYMKIFNFVEILLFQHCQVN